MPRIKLLKTDTGNSYFGKYLSIHEFIQYKKDIKEYHAALKQILDKHENMERLVDEFGYTLI